MHVREASLQATQAHEHLIKHALDKKAPHLAELTAQAAHVLDHHGNQFLSAQLKQRQTNEAGKCMSPTPCSACIYIVDCTVSGKPPVKQSLQSALA